MGIWIIDLLSENSLSETDWFRIFPDSHCIRNTVRPLKFPAVLLFTSFCLNLNEPFFKCF